jgi:hypothetical protein
MSDRGPTVALLLLLTAVACTDVERRPAPLPTEAIDVQSTEPAAPAVDRTELVALLRRQSVVDGDADESALASVREIRLDADYTTAELALLAELPGLREVMIWRDGEQRGAPAPAAAPTDDDLRALAGLTQVETLRLGGWSAPLTDAGVAHLVALPSLRRLDLIQVQSITDAAMEHVAAMPALELLDITYTKISDGGLAHLLASESLRTVKYGWAGESRRWLQAFRSAHPEATFTIE